MQLELLKQVVINDIFWNSYLRTVREVVIPFQWEALNDRIPGASKSYCVSNFKIAAGLAQGEFGGMVFQDSDLGKWIEAVGYSLAQHQNEQLESTTDEIIDILVMGQQPDGYINTYYLLKEPGNRFTNLLDCHELYSLGHLIEGAVSYYLATGKRKLLDAMCRYADLVDNTFGTENGKIRGYCGHEEIELALVKLYGITGEERYRRLASYFIDERGREPNFFVEEWEKRDRHSHWTQGKTSAPNLTYNQSHVPVREQGVAIGHAVRAVYLYSAMADLALLNSDMSMKTACETIWDNIVNKQMYITGSIGSTSIGEAFTSDYDLPNDANYSETCASIGLIMFAERMLRLSKKGCYGDIMEKALYNTVLSGMSVDGKHYFYVNPMEVFPEISQNNPVKRHMLHERPAWFGCACCPPNVVRLLGSLNTYIHTYDKNANALYMNLYIGSVFESDGIRVALSGDYLADGHMTLIVEENKNGALKIALRVPYWCETFDITVNGEKCCHQIKDGYCYPDKPPMSGDKYDIYMPPEAKKVFANTKVPYLSGKTAIQRGPIIYCLEECDNVKDLSSISLSRDAELRTVYEEDTLGGTYVIYADALREINSSGDDSLYSYREHCYEDAIIKAVPYYLWANRQPGSMVTWIRIQM